MDVLDEILGSLRLTGGVITDAKFSGEFCLSAEFTPEKCAPFFPMPETLIAYHYVRSGEVVAQVGDMPPTTLKAGELVIMPRNEPHLLASRPGLKPVPVEEVTVITADGLHQISCGAGGAPAEVWCGFLGTAKHSAHPLLDALPSMLVIDVSGGEAQWLDSSMRFLAEQSASPEIVARLAELFLAQAIREYVDRLPPGSTGWLRGLADPAVSKALSIIHTRYAEELDVEGLAREAGVSRTVLGERFAELIGEPPMRYCARWRMRVASNMLREGKQNTANIGYAVGFNSEAAFNRAFKREFGEPPVTWRRRVEAEEQARAVAATGRSGRARPSDAMGRCKGRDGSEIAFAVAGTGFPMFKAPNWMTHLEHDWTSPVYGPWYELACDMGQLVRMDLRGFGMSDREPREFTFDAMVEDMKAVVDAAGIEQCDLIGVSHGAAFAIAFAGRYPERVRKLVLVNSFAAGWRVRADPEEIAWRESLLEMNRRQPSFRRSLLGEMFITLYFPSASDKLIAWHNEHFATLGPVANMQPMIELASMIDVREELAKIEAPTLVFHANKDGNAPISVGRQVADGIKGARFIELDSANHVLLGDEPAWEVFERETRAFLSEGERPLAAQGDGPATVRDLRPNQLMVSGTPTGVNWVTRHIDEFLNANPDLSVELIPDPQNVDFDKSFVDCAIRCGTRRPTGVAVEDLFEVDFTPMCSPEFLARWPELRSPEGLLGVTRITPTDPWWPQVWRHFGLEAASRELRGAVMGAQVLDGLAALRGQGVALLTPMFWRDEIQAGELVCLYDDLLDGHGTYWFVYPESRADWSKIRRFSNWLHGLSQAGQTSEMHPVLES